MISKKHRFSGSKTIASVYKIGKSARSGPFSIRFIEVGDKYKLAVVVSKKVSKSAVVRNRIRRRVFEQTRKIFAEVAPSNCQIVFSVYKVEVADMDSNELKNRLDELFKDLVKKP